MSGSLARLVLRAQGQLPVAAPLLPSRFAPVGPGPATLVDRLRHLVPAMSLSADSNGGQAATIGWESSEPVAPLDPFETEAGWGETTADPASTSPDDSVLSVCPEPPVQPLPPGPQAQPDAQAAMRPDLSQAAPLPQSAAPVSDRASPARGRAAPPWTPADTLAAPVAPNTPDRIGPAPVPPPAAQTMARPEPVSRTLSRDPHPPAAAPKPARSPAQFPPFHAEKPAPTPATAPAPASPRIPDVHISIGRLEVHAAPARTTPVHSAPMRRPQLSLADYLAQRK
jgi:hypothetical protein